MTEGLSIKDFTVLSAQMILVCALMIAAPVLAGSYNGTFEEAWKMPLYVGATFAAIPFAIFTLIFVVTLPITVIGLILERFSRVEYVPDIDDTPDMVGGIA